MSTKTTLQQLMGGTSNVKEAFTFPGMGDIYSKATGDETGDDTGEDTTTTASDKKTTTSKSI